MNRRILMIVVAVALVGVALVIWKAKPKPAAVSEAPKDPNTVELSEDAQRNGGVAIGQVEERSIRRTVRATGIVTPDQARVGHVFPLARGIVEKVDVQLGQRVAKGQALVRYDNIELGQVIGEYLKLRGDLDKQAAQEQVAKKNLDRAQALIEVEAIPQREFDVRKAEYQQAVAGLESQRADSARVEEQLHRFGMEDPDIRSLSSPTHEVHRTASHSVLRAPLSGVITKFDVSTGEVVEKDKELFTIVDTSTVWVLADLYENDLGSVKTGGFAQIQVPSYPGETFKGKIDYISDFLDPSSRTAKVRCVVANPDGRLKLEMFASVEVPSTGTSSALAVPSSAVQKVESDDVVFVRKDATHFEKRVVELGQRSEDWVEVKKGLKASDAIVTKGSFYLKSSLLREQIGEE
jgi:cobalt-zinc-cadmium efflux system membrane fusion protein